MVKQLYLCSKCKKAGVKSSKAKMFESFFCPNCNQNRTLFLPEPKKELQKAPVPVTKEAPVPNELPWGVPLPPQIPVIEYKTDKIIKSYNSVSIWNVVVFVMGFVAALLVMKIR